eukprot:1724523-Amphidinium_carterae.1
MTLQVTAEQNSFEFLSYVLGQILFKESTELLLTGDYGFKAFSERKHLSQNGDGKVPQNNPRQSKFNYSYLKRRPLRKHCKQRIDPATEVEPPALGGACGRRRLNPVSFALLQPTESNTKGFSQNFFQNDQKMLTCGNMPRK